MKYPLGRFFRVSDRTAWCKHGPIEVFIRRARRIYKGKAVDTFDIASLSTPKPGTGTLGALFGEVEMHAHETYRYVFVENVLNPRLEEWLKRRGYTADPYAAPVCYWKKP